MEGIMDALKEAIKFDAQANLTTEQVEDVRQIVKTREEESIGGGAWQYLGNTSCFHSEKGVLYFKMLYVLSEAVGGENERTQ